MSDLKSCPCCGGEAGFNFDYGGYNWIECKSCGTTTECFRDEHISAEVRLLRLWNNRPYENKLKAEAVREAANKILGNPPLNDQYDEFMDHANKLERGKV